MTSIRKNIAQLFTSRNDIIIVSGLPRSGTSMMMSALKAGGMKLLVDQARQADANNPNGYFEFERVKQLQHEDTEWLQFARGKAVKVISALLQFLPDEYHYKIVFMERDLDEVLASQTRMLVRDGKDNLHPVPDDELRRSYEEHLREIKHWLEGKTWIQILFVSYNDILCRPVQEFKRVASFLDRCVDPQRMAQVLDAELYRERS